MRSAIYIDRNNLYYYGGNVHAPVAFPFPNTSVNDMEIVNEEELTTKIAEWIKTNKIEASPAIILLANNVYFQKEIPTDTPAEKQTEMKQLFTENIPFNSTHVQEIPTGKSTLLVAVNTEFAYTIRDIFQSYGFTIEAIAPIATVYGTQPVSSFSAQVAQDAFKKISKEAGVPLRQVEDTHASAVDDPLPTKKSSNRLFIMVGVFVILLGVLVIVYMMSRRPKKTEHVELPPIAEAPATQTVATSPTPEASGEATLTKLKTDLSIQILNGSGVAGQADTIRRDLEEIGFDNITTGNATGAQTNRALIIFKSDVAEIQRNEIIEVIEPFVDDYAVQEKDDIDVDILITTSIRTVTTTP